MPLCLVLGASVARAELVVPASVGAYTKALHSSASVECIFRLGLQAADDVLLGRGAPDLESLSESDFAALQDSMKGFVLFRDEGTWAGPDVEFFTKLSQARGDSISADFFETYWRSDSYGSPLPYIELRTDYSGCTKYGSLELVRCYRFWDGFRRRHPDRYADRVEGFLSAVERELTDGTCACEGKDETLREFREFVKEFPNASITPQVRERIQSLEAGTSGIHYHCFPG